MSLETRNLITEKEFGPELAGARIGWSAITGYGRRPDEVLGVHLVTTTIAEDGASIEYEPREKDGEPFRAYWSDAAKGFIASAGITLVLDKTRKPDEQRRIGPYWSSNDDIIKGSSDGRLLRRAGDGHNSEDELREKRVWAENPSEIMANIKTAMHEAGLEDYYPIVYYTANVLLAHDNFRGGTSLWGLSPEALLLPDSSMHAMTEEQIVTAGTIADNLVAEYKEDETILRNLTVFGDIPRDQIPAAFKASREKVAAAEQEAVTAEKNLHVQHGVFLPVGFQGGRSWPYMDASLPPTDERAFGMELAKLSEGKTGLAERELERERGELETRIRFARDGLAALRLLSRAEVELQAA